MRIIKNNFNEGIQNTQTLQKHRLISAYRRGQNLLDFLVKSKEKPLIKLKPKTKTDYLYTMQ